MIFARIICAATAALAVVLSASPATAGDEPFEPLVNRGFEAGMSGWTCAAGSAAVVTSGVHSGSRALAGAAGTADNAHCTQPMRVFPGVTFRVTAWVRGRYVLMGVRGHAPAWKPGGDDSYQLELTFRAGPTQTWLPFYFAGTNGRPYVVDEVRIEVLCPTDDPAPCPSLFWP